MLDAVNSKSNRKNNDFVSFEEDPNETTWFEGMTSISAILHGMESGINSRRIIRILFDRERLHKKEKEYRYLHAMAEKMNFLLEWTSEEALDTITTGKTHGGIVAECSPRSLPTLSQALSDEALPFCCNDGFFVMLEGIEDPYNFGYTLRSLYAAGVDGIILPPRNWMAVAGVVSRSSAGASELLPMAVASPEEAISLLRRRGIKAVCAGIRDSVSMYDADLKRPLLLVVGGEKRGISSAVLKEADEIVRIDYGRTFRGSLSAASAATVLAFEILRQNDRQP